MSECFFPIRKYIDFCESTNTYLKENIKDKHQNVNCVVRTGFQYKGRGQTGNFWESEKDKNLLLSCCIYPKSLLAGQQFILFKFVSLALFRVLRHYLPEKDLKIKWPNDLYYHNEKLAGVLIENTIMGDKIQNTIIGIGLNVNQMQFYSEAKNPTSLALLLKHELDVDRIEKQLLDSLAIGYSMLGNSKLDLLNNEYLTKLYRINNWHRFKIKGREYLARIVGVDNFGFLLLDYDGKRQSYDIKEVEYIF